MRVRRLSLILLLASALALIFVSADAQIGDEDPCRTACREMESDCVSECGSHSDPIECEDRCQAAAEQCKADCD